MATITLKHGDVVEQLKLLDDDSVDAIITDPPYNLNFMGKKWDNIGAPLEFQEWCSSWATECLRVLRKGGYLLSFGGTRTFHRTASGIEDAGFVIKDCLSWNYGSGFPKSHNISKAIDKKAGAKPEVIGYSKGHRNNAPPIAMVGAPHSGDGSITEPSTIEAQQWDGYGTALKPAWEPIILAQKPFKGTIVNNVLTHGLGGMNIDATRIKGGGTYENYKGSTYSNRNHSGLSKSHIAGSKNRTAEENNAIMKEAQMKSIDKMNTHGRWPANTIFDEGAGTILNEQSGDCKTGAVKPYLSKGENSAFIEDNLYRNFSQPASSGGAARFFYCPKTPKKEKTCLGFVENAHPTVKPIKLMEWLIKLVCPTADAMGRQPVIIDCFVGSGSTAIAANRVGVDCIGIDSDGDSLTTALLRLMNDWRLEEGSSPVLKGYSLDLATLKQIKFIKRLGGDSQETMTKDAASAMINGLLSNNGDE
jgi:site-specific DNA-methyltransferase (adenine-specific)